MKPLFKDCYCHFLMQEIFLKNMGKKSHLKKNLLAKLLSDVFPTFPASISVKSVHIRSCSGPHSPAFGRCECGKMRTRITPTTDTFYAVSVFGYENSFIIQRRVSAFFCHLIKYAGFSIVSFSWSFSIGSQYMYTLRLTIRL